MSFARKSCNLCVVFVGCSCCCDRRYDRGLAQKLRSLRCVRVSVLLRPKLRSRFCAKVAIFVLYSCCCCCCCCYCDRTYNRDFAIETCNFLCGGGACVSFVFDLTQKLQSLCCGRVLPRFFQDV